MILVIFEQFLDKLMLVEFIVIVDWWLWFLFNMVDGFRLLLCGWFWVVCVVCFSFGQIWFGWWFVGIGEGEYCVFVGIFIVLVVYVDGDYLIWFDFFEEDFF